MKCNQRDQSVRDSRRQPPLTCLLSVATLPVSEDPLCKSPLPQVKCPVRQNRQCHLPVSADRSSYRNLILRQNSCQSQGIHAYPCPPAGSCFPRSRLFLRRRSGLAINFCIKGCSLVIYVILSSQNCSACSRPVHLYRKVEYYLETFKEDADIALKVERGWGFE